jgi:predicted ABC-type ATPase
MIGLSKAVKDILRAQKRSRKPLAVVLAGHNGAGKSTMWYGRLADDLQIPLINADRMMMSILPEARDGMLPRWASALRDENRSWMQVAQGGVQAFVAEAMSRAVPFAMETVFSDWRPQPDGTIASKIDLIRNMQAADYFVVLIFVGLSNAQLSMGRVATRVEKGGHDVAPAKLAKRFPRTQRAIAAALDVADAAILVDNSRTQEDAFTVAHVRLAKKPLFDLRDGRTAAPAEILEWLNIVVPWG